MSETANRRFPRWLRRAAAIAAVGGAAGILAVVALFLYVAHDLPSGEALKSYRPPQVTKVYCAGGVLCGEFYQERRTVVPIGSLPAHVKNAFLAAEDADFYNHEGLDYLGMARAALKSLLPGGRMTGASTITQQVCRNILLTQERTPRWVHGFNPGIRHDRRALRHNERQCFGAESGLTQRRVDDNLTARAQIVGWL